MSSIKDLWEKIKGFSGFRLPRFRKIPDDLFLGLIIILVAFGSFGLGRLSKIEGAKAPIRIENAPESADSWLGHGTITFAPQSSSTAIIAPSIQGSDATDTQLVGSKNGTKYYYPWCTGVSKISPANLIHFASKADAEARGYTPSATCKGL
jgi:hypothetical protein